MNNVKWDFNDPKLPDNTLAYHKADHEYKMLVKQGDTICTTTTDDDGNTMILTSVYKGTQKWIACYKMVVG